MKKKHSVSERLATAETLLVEARGRVEANYGERLDEDAFQTASMEVWIWLLSRLAMGHEMCAADARRQLYRRYQYRRIDGFKRWAPMDVRFLIDENGITDSGPVDRAQRQALRGVFHSTLSELQQHVVRRVFQDGMSLREIAHETGLSKSEVHRLLHESLDELKTAIETQEEL